MLFSLVEQNKRGRLVQMPIYGDNSYLGHISKSRLEFVIPKYSIHTSAVIDSYTFTSKH